MSLENFKKYISTSLISLCGYAVLAFSMKYLFFDIPHAIKLDKIEQIHEGITHFDTDATIPYLSSYICVISVIIFLFICFLVELYLKDNDKIKTLKFLENQNRAKSILFWLGYILIPFPIYLFFIGIFVMFFFYLH